MGGEALHQRLLVGQQDMNKETQGARIADEHWKWFGYYPFGYLYQLETKLHT